MMLTGCAGYRQGVANHFRDAVKLNVGVGVGLYARVKATSFLDAGIGWSGIWENVGFEDRNTDFFHPSEVACLFPMGVVPGAIGYESPWSALRMANVWLTHPTNMEADLPVVGELFDWKAVTQWDAYGKSKRSPHQMFESPDEPQFTTQPLGFEAAAGIGIVNVSAGFDPVEFCGFVASLFGADLEPKVKPSPQTAAHPKGETNK